MDKGKKWRRFVRANSESSDDREPRSRLIPSQSESSLANLSFIIGGVSCAVLAANELLRVISLVFDSSTVGVFWLLGMHFGICYSIPGVVSVVVGAVALLRGKRHKKGIHRAVAGVVFGLVLIVWVIYWALVIGPAIAGAL